MIVCHPRDSSRDGKASHKHFGSNLPSLGFLSVTCVSMPHLPSATSSKSSAQAIQYTLKHMFIFLCCHIHTVTYTISKACYTFTLYILLLCIYVCPSSMCLWFSCVLATWCMTQPMLPGDCSKWNLVYYAQDDASHCWWLHCYVQTLAASLDEAVRPEDSYFNKLIRIMATRCMTQAVYFGSGEVDPPDYLHYGLAAPLYTHFTSPIRR